MNKDIQYKSIIDTEHISDLIQLIDDGRITKEEVQGKKIFIDVIEFEQSKELIYKIYIV